MDQELEDDLDLGYEPEVDEAPLHTSDTDLDEDDAEDPDSEVDLQRIHREQFAFVWRTLRNLGVPTALLDDAVQDVFLVVHRRLDDFEGRSSVRTWLFGIARRVAYRYRRSAARQQRKLDALADDPQPRPLSPYAVVAQGEALDILTGFLDSLDDAKREVFVLHTLEGVTGGEIASTLGISVNTVHSRLRLARRSFERMCESLHVREQRALASARQASEPPADARRRAWALLVPMIELPRGATTATATWSLAGQVKVFVATVAVGAGTLGAVKVSTEHPGDTPSVLVASASAAAPLIERTRPPRMQPPEPEAIEPGVRSAEPELEPAENDAEGRAKPKRSTLARETQAMLRLRTLVHGGDTDAALAQLDELDRRYPNGAFVVERAGYRVIARCDEQGAPSPAARADARAFVDAHAGSSVAGQVRARCLGREH